MISTWKKLKVGDLISYLESGVSVNSTEEKPIDNSLCVLKVSAVTYGKFNPNAAKKITEADIHRAKCNPKKGHIIISRSNTPNLVGASVFVDKDYPARFLPDKLWQAILNQKHQVNSKWLFYYLSSPRIRYQLSKLATGSSNSMKNITKDELLSLSITLPPLEQQNNIVFILDHIETIIDKTETLIAAKEKQFELLKNMLINDDVETRKCELSKFAKIAQKEKITTLKDSNPLIVKLHCKGIVANKQDIKIVLSAKGRPYYKRFSGEFLIGRQNFHNGGFGVVPKELNGFIASNAITSLDIDESKLSPEYLFYYLSRKNYYLRIAHIMESYSQIWCMTV